MSQERSIEVENELSSSQYTVKIATRYDNELSSSQYTVKIATRYDTKSDVKLSTCTTQINDISVLLYNSILSSFL